LEEAYRDEEYEFDIAVKTDVLLIGGAEGDEYVPCGPYVPLMLVVADVMADDG